MKTMMETVKRSIKHGLLIVLSSWLFAAVAVASEFRSISFPVNGAQTYLPVDQAFQFTALQDNEQLLLRWQIAPGYYLYRDRIQIRQADLVLSVVLPGGIEKQDETFGLVQVFYGLLELTVPLSDGLDPVHIEYQGCAEAGLCYPPRWQSVPLR